MKSPRELHYSLIHPETIVREFESRGCWVVQTTGLVDTEVGYPPGVLICAPAPFPQHGCTRFEASNGRMYWNVPERSAYYLNAGEAGRDLDWFWRADYGRVEGKAAVEAGGCAPPAYVDPDEPIEPAAGDTPPLPSGEVRVVSDTGGAKGSKPCQMAWAPPSAMMELGKLYGIGAAKYDDPLNYTNGYDWSLSINAMLRHLWQWMDGEQRDADNGGHHLAAVMWHCCALMHFEEHHPEFDDRLSTRVARGRAEAQRERDEAALHGEDRAWVLAELRKMADEEESVSLPEKYPYRYAEFDEAEDDAA